MKSEVKLRNYGFCLLWCTFWLVFLSFPGSAWERIPRGSASKYRAIDEEIALGNMRLSLITTGIPRTIAAKKNICSNQTLEALTTQMLRDLPSYANRASQRSRRLSRKKDIFSYIVAAGRPEFEPLPLKPSEYTQDSLKTKSDGVEQVFFTTLERQYVSGKAIQLQEFHWLFLTKAENSWLFVMMFSQIGSNLKNQPPTPPRDSSNGVIAQGISNWLRDCTAESVRVRSRNLEGKP